MNDIKISIIIKSNCDISAITSLLQQTNNAWECFVVNNTIKNIDQFIINDNRFKIVNDTTTNDIIKNIIAKASGNYILLINSDDILTPDAIDNLLHMIYFTNADIIKFNSRILSDDVPNISDKKCRFKYIFNKHNIMDYAFSDLSEICIKKDIIHEFSKSEHAFVTNILSNAKDMALTKKTCIIKQRAYNLYINDVIENYKENHDKLSYDFWVKYFKQISQQIIINTIRNNDKLSFIRFCNEIPLKLIPWRYRIMCYILKKTNK